MARMKPVLCKTVNNVLNGDTARRLGVRQGRQSHSDVQYCAQNLSPSDVHISEVSGFTQILKVSIITESQKLQQEQFITVISTAVLCKREPFISALIQLHVKFRHINSPQNLQQLDIILFKLLMA
jgi:hypothetical protein